MARWTPPVGAARGVMIAEVARILGVPMPTLRSWEARYGIPATIRRHGQHRRYPPTELHALRLMRDEIARGTRASQAADRVRELQNVQGPPAALIDRFLAAARQGEVPRLHEVLDTAAELIGTAACIDQVMLPALRQVGSWWTAGECDAGPERDSTQAIRAWLGRRTTAAPAPTQARPVILAGGPGQVHTVGAEALALLLRESGRPIRLIGPRTDLPALLNAVADSHTAAVVITAQLATGRRPTVTTLHTLNSLKIPLFYAGNAFNTLHTRRRTPGTFLGNNIEQARDLVLAALPRISA